MRAFELLSMVYLREDTAVTSRYFDGAEKLEDCCKFEFARRFAAKTFEPGGRWNWQGGGFISLLGFWFR